jgi:hypothetical protein
VACEQEQVRAILRKRQNAKPKRKAPALGPEPAQPVSIPVACRCSKYPHSHVHITLVEPYAVKVAGEAAFEYLREQIRERAEQPPTEFDDYAFLPTQAMPPSCCTVPMPIARGNG